MTLKGRSFLTLRDFTAEEITYLIDLAAELKEKKRQGIMHDSLVGKNIVLIFEKTSTRTRCSFEVAAHDLGMHVTYLDPASSQFGGKESVADTARVLGRMYDGIEYRGFAQETVEELAKYAGVPVWNNLQCQQMAAILPSKYKQQYIELVEPNVKEMIKGLGLDFGAVFLQGFWKGNKVYMYDPGLRFPGTDFDVVTKEVTGFDAMKSFVRFALTGDINSCYGDINLAYNYNDKFCLILSVSIKAGVIDIIEGIEEIVKHPYVIDYYQRYHKGDVISNYGDIRQRVLEFVMYIPNYNEIKNFIDFAYKTLKIIDTQGNDMIVSRVVLN